MSEESKRSTNFSLREETLLVSLVKKYKEILECKLSNTNVNRKKAACWKNIEKEFNGLGETCRSDKVLRKKYENIKKRTKKKFAEEKMHRGGTGGGPEKVIKISPIDEEIKELLGVRVEGNLSEFDGDASSYEKDIFPSYFKDTENIISPEKEQTSENELIAIDFQSTAADQSNDGAEPPISAGDEILPSVLEPLTTNYNDNSSSSSTNRLQHGDWSNYSSSMLRQKKSQALNTKRSEKLKQSGNSVITGKISQWAEAKAAIEGTKQRFMEEEWKLKFKHMQEKHEKELQMMDFEMQLKREEHKLKMKLLVQEHEKKMMK